MIIRILTAGVALVSLFIFPAPFTACIVFLASCIVPPIGIVAGALTDMLYGTPHMFLPYATLLGGSATLIGLLVQGFIRTRIIG